VSRPPWWAAFPDLETTVQCDGAGHRLRWARGELIAANHPDTESEFAFAALGGALPECVAVAEAWRRHSDDLDVLALGPRSPADALDATGDWLDWPQPLGPLWEAADQSSGLLAALSGPGSRAGPNHGPRPGTERRRRSWPGPLTVSVYSPPGTEEQAYVRRNELLCLFALGPGFQLRLSATVAAAWSSRRTEEADPAGVGLDRARPALTAALAGRLAPAAESWLGIDPDEVVAGLYEDSGWGSVRLDRANGITRLHVSLPAEWLARVWAPGLAVVGDYLVLDVLDVAWPRASVRAVPRLATGAVTLTILHDGGRWTVRPDRTGSPAA
jgi:hypothetical protein